MLLLDGEGRADAEVQRPFGVAGSLRMRIIGRCFRIAFEVRRGFWEWTGWGRARRCAAYRSGTFGRGTGLGGRGGEAAVASALGLLFFLLGTVYDLDGALGKGVVADASLGKRVLGVRVAVGVG